VRLQSDKVRTNVPPWKKASHEQQVRVRELAAVPPAVASSMSLKQLRGVVVVMSSVTLMWDGEEWELRSKSAFH
jgi:hypothetical protein